jgi:hypothetical protein
VAAFDNILSALREWRTWKRIEEAPDRIDSLERRIGELEGRLARAPGEACPKCGALEFRVERTERHPELGEVGCRIHHMKCGECGFADEKLVVPR